MANQQRIDLDSAQRGAGNPQEHSSGDETRRDGR